MRIRRAFFFIKRPDRFIFASAGQYHHLSAAVHVQDTRKYGSRRPPVTKAAGKAGLCTVKKNPESGRCQILFFDCIRQESCKRALPRPLSGANADQL